MFKDQLILLLESQGEDVLHLMMQANSLRQTDEITYSKNVFLPLTNICRNECGYCTFRRNPEDDDATLVMPPQEVMATIHQADEYGCREALLHLENKLTQHPRLNMP